MRRFPLILLLAAGVATATPRAPSVAIQPLGEVNSERVEVVRKGLAAAYGLPVTVLKAKPMPGKAWYAPRGRYRADALLDHLSTTTPESHRIVIGLTAKDISITKGAHEDWGIFGLGEIDGRACVVSTYRLNARGADETKLRERLRKVAVHEVGHVMGNPHCPREGCVMRDAEASIATVDGETGTLCPACKRECQAWIERNTTTPSGPGG